MKFLRNIFSQLHTFVLWLLISVLLWAWVFSFLTDTSREKKVMLFAHVGELHDRDLTLRLEAHKPEGIKMIKVHDFEYQMIDTSKTFGDLYIVPQSELEQMLEKDPGAVLEILDPGTIPPICSRAGPWAFWPMTRKPTAAWGRAAIFSIPARSSTARIITSASAATPCTIPGRRRRWTRLPGR